MPRLEEDEGYQRLRVQLAETSRKIQRVERDRRRLASVLSGCSPVEFMHKWDALEEEQQRLSSDHRVLFEGLLRLRRSRRHPAARR